MNIKNLYIKKGFHPQKHVFGNTVASNEEVYFGENLIVMHSNYQMLRHTIGDGFPYRLQSLRIGLLTQGSMDSLVNLEERHTKKGTLELYSTGTLFQLNNASPDFRAFELIFTPPYLNEQTSNDLLSLFHMKAMSISVELDKEEEQHYRDMLNLLLYFAKTEGEHSPVTRSMTNAVLQYTVTLFRKHMKRDDTPMSRQETVFHEFARLVTLSHGRQRRHSYFAEQLHVSEHYLSLAVKQTSGMTAKEWIDRVVVTEIKLLLLHTDLTISQIANELEFPSDSFLCKFFRRHTGMTPMAFRTEK